jgi:hypothetical protein
MYAVNRISTTHGGQMGRFLTSEKTARNHVSIIFSKLAPKP